MELVEALQQRAPRITVGADKAYDNEAFVEGMRFMEATPHVAQNAKGRRSLIDERTTRHACYAVSQVKRKRVEEIFGWLTTVALLRKLRHRGGATVEWIFTFAAAAYNLVRVRNLTGAATWVGKLRRGAMMHITSQHRLTIINPRRADRCDGVASPDASAVSRGPGRLHLRILRFSGTC